MKVRAAAFLDRFRLADRDDALLHLLVDDFDGLAAAMAETPDALLAAADAAVVAAGPPVDIHSDSFASAACDVDGNLIVAEARFCEWLGAPDCFSAVVRKCSDSRPSVSTIADDRTGRPVAVAAATLAIARRWPLAPTVRAALEQGAGSHAIVAFRPDITAWERAARAYGLSPQESRLAAALARRGDLKLAARDTGVAYETARKLVSAAMRKVGASRQTDLLHLILSVAAGGLHPPEGAIRLFADLFGLSLRQAELARAIAHGATRDGAAQAQGISFHGGKAALKIVFQACGVTNAVDLARLVAEVDALVGLATACSVEIEPRGGDIEPLRLIARRWAPGRIAVTDHGNGHDRARGGGRGRPLLMFHNAVGGRHHPRRLVVAMQAAGWRPISFDRPGFGLSDVAGDDPFAAAAADVGDILDALEIERATIFARGGSTAAVTTAAALADRIAGGLLVGPEPPIAYDSRFVGMMGRGKALFFGNPVLAAAFARILSRRTSSAQIARMQRQSVAGSAIDENVLNDPDAVADIVRASRQSALGMHGFLAELQAHGNGAEPPTLAAAGNWVVMAGAHDPLYDFEPSRGFWERTLPGAAIHIIADGGRWLHLTHGDAIIAALASIAAK